MISKNGNALTPGQDLLWLIKQVSESQRKNVLLHAETYVVDSVTELLYRIYTPREKSQAVLYQLCVPAMMKAEVLYLYHNHPIFGGHLSIGKAFYKLSRNFFWPGYHDDLEGHIKKCEICQRRRVPAHAALPPLRPFRVSNLFEMVSVDHIGPLSTTKSKPSHNFNYIIVFVEYLTRYVVAIPAASCGAEETAEIFLREIVFKFGSCDTIISDRHRTFRSTTYQELLDVLGVKTKFTSSYHDQCNGLTERNNQKIKKIMSAIMEEHSNWPSHVAVAQFLINSTPCATTGRSPLELLLGRQASIAIPYDGDINEGISSPVLGRILDEISTTQNIYRRLKIFQEPLITTISWETVE
jgi:putative transposase